MTPVQSHGLAAFEQPLQDLRTAAAIAFARERLASIGHGDSEEELIHSWGRADAAARTILEGSRRSDPDWALARYEAMLWLDGAVDGTLRNAQLPGPVPGSLEAVSVAGLVATVETIDGLAEVTRAALACAESAGTASHSLAQADPDASHVLCLFATLARSLAASAADRLDRLEPRSPESARRRAAAPVAHTLSKTDAHALERAAMIATQAEQEICDLEPQRQASCNAPND